MARWKNLKRSHQKSNELNLQLTTEIDNYEYACNNIVVFDMILSEIANAKTHQGRKLKPSSKNRITTDKVTPDLSFEERKNGKYRAINEIKAWLPNDKEQWIEVVDQLQSYDDDLTDWEFSGNEKHDIMLTIDPRFTNSFHDYLDNLQTTKNIKIERNFAIIQSSKQERALPSIFVRKDFGVIDHEKLDKALSDGIPKIMYNIGRDLDKVKFYDAKPPVIYTMMQMWDHIFSKYINSREKRTKMDNGQTVNIDLDVDKIYEKLSELTHDSNPNCLKKSWIIDALNEFVSIGLAESSPNGSRFKIKYRKHGGFTEDFILGLMQKKEEAKIKPMSNGLDKFIDKKDEQNTEENKS